MPKHTQDFTAIHHGSIVLVKPENDDARQWLDDSVQSDAQYMGGALVVEPRYFDYLAAGIVEAGFSIAVN